ncbi:serine hydrolase [Streptomyces sp. YIM 98790]|uniref:serine hydrolase domain-containing protein n=1 Tax=Streptomyces sp. YIM 98790 TaxID=2689077 RepID=UPI00140904DE|nr:serine hydrolase domain-containing protein [Streptomyces sp. YIM 98790]
MVAVHGRCDERFTAVRTAFEENFRARGELGAAVTVLVGGEPVADLWGGWADPGRTRPWERDTLVNVWSTTKGVTALCAHLLADRGLLDLDAPVAAYWPEFAAAGKENIPVRDLLSHRAGLAGLREPHSAAELYDWKLTCDRLAATEPWWEPGSAFGYHALTYGFLVGEVIRRVSGRMPAAFLREELTGPLGIDFSIGLPESEEHRVAELLHEPAPAGADSEQARLLTALPPVALAALGNPRVGGAHANTPAWRRADLPALNGHGTARAVAALYGIWAGGGRYGDREVLSPAAVARARQGQGPGQDLALGQALGREMDVALGLWLSGPHGSYGPNPLAFGHDGFGGSFGLADPESGVAIGYVMNRMGAHIMDDPRKTALIEAVYASL